MLVLCSNGISGENLARELGKRIGSRGSAALVVTADNVYKDKNYHVARCRKDLEALGLTVGIFDIDTQSPRRLLNYDLVEFIGGNPFYLLNAIRNTDAMDVLRELAEKKILIGWSAAAFAFGPSLELVNQYSPEMNGLGLTDLNGICLTDVEVLPHYNKFLSRFENFEAQCSAYEAKKGVRVIRLNDGDGVIVDGASVLICRG